MRKNLGVLFIMFGLLALNAGCTDQSAKGDTSASKSGRWTGFIVDGKSGAKLNFFNGTADTNNATDNNSAVDQVYVVVDGNIKSATPCGTEDAALGFQAGCFTVDSLPTGIALPVFVVKASYVPFAGTVTIDPTVVVAANPGNNGTGPIFADKPQLYKNVRVFPTGVDYSETVTVTINNKGVAAVDVQCVYDNSANQFDNVGNGTPSNYVNPSNDFNAIVTGTTDANGQVVFAGTTLTKGAGYICTAQSSGADGVVLSYLGGAPDFTVGVSLPSVELPLTIGTGQLVAIWNNYQNSTSAPLGAAGTMQIVFNRPVSIRTGSQDCQKATVASTGSGLDGVAAAMDPLADQATPATAVSEQLTVTVSTDGLTLSIVPKYSAATATKATDDLGLQIQNIGGIFLQPTTGIGSTGLFKIGDVTTGLDTSAFKFNEPGTDTCGTLNGAATAVVDLLGGGLTTAHLTGL